MEALLWFGRLVDNRRSDLSVDIGAHSGSRHLVLVLVDRDTHSSSSLGTRMPIQKYFSGAESHCMIDLQSGSTSAINLVSSIPRRPFRFPDCRCNWSAWLVPFVAGFALETNQQNALVPALCNNVPTRRVVNRTKHSSGLRIDCPICSHGFYMTSGTRDDGGLCRTVWSLNRVIADGVAAKVPFHTPPRRCGSGRCHHLRSPSTNVVGVLAVADS